MKNQFILSVLSIIYLSAGAQSTAEFRSVQSGQWDNPATWELMSSSGWVRAPHAPDSLAAKISINSRDTIYVASNFTARNLNLYGALIISKPGNIRLYGAANTIHPGGQVINQGVITSSAQLPQFLNGSKYIHRWDTAEGSIPSAIWDAESIVEISGYTNQTDATAAGNWSQSFGHFTWNTPNLANDFSLNGLLNQIRGKLTILNTNGYVLRLTNSQTADITIQGDLQVLDQARFSISRSGPNSSHVVANIGGDFIFQSGAPLGSRICEQGTSVINVAGKFVMDKGVLFFSSGSGGTSSAGADLKVAGDVLFTGGTIDASVANSNRVGDLYFTGKSEQKFIAQGTVVGSFHYRLTSGSKVVVPEGSRMTGSSFECDGCTFIAESIDPAGAIQKSATGGGSIRVRSQFWNPGSIIIYRSTAKQFISSDHPQQTGITTLIDNAAGVEVSSSGSGVIAGGNIEILRGGLTVSQNNLTIRGNLNTYGGPVLVTSSGLTSARTLTIDGELLLTGAGERLKIESSSAVNAANAVLTLNGNIGGTGFVSFSGPNAQVQIGGVARTFRRPLPVIEPFQLEQLSMNAPSTTLAINQPLTLGNYTSSTNSWTGGLIIQAGTVKMNASLIIRTVAGLVGGTLDFSGQELELRRNIQTNWPVGGFAGNKRSVMKVTSGFAGVDNVVAFIPGRDTIGSLILDRSANVQAVGGLPVTPHIKINSPLIISKTLELKDGELYHQSGIVLMEGATILRTPDAAFSSSTFLPPAGGPYRLEYKDGQTTADVSAGVETQGELKTLRSDLTRQLTLRSTIRISDSLTVVRGKVALSTDTLSMGRVELWGLLKVERGATINTGNGQLILKSNSPEVGGRVGVLEPEAVVEGNVTVENFMPAKGSVFRYISSSVKGVTFKDFRDDFDFYPEYLYQYHEQMLGYKDIGWIRNLTVDSLLRPGKGYLIHPRSGYEYKDNIWDMTGPLARGSVKMPVIYTPSNPASYPDDGWNLLGNPYASPVFWSLDPEKWSDGEGRSMQNIDPIVFVKDYSGTYGTWDAETGIGDLSGGTGIIPTGSAFWVHAYGQNPKLVMHEQAKAPSGGIFYRKAGEIFGGLKISVSAASQSASCFLLNRYGSTPLFERGRDALQLRDSVLSISLESSDGFPLVHYASEDLPVEIPLLFSKLVSDAAIQIHELPGKEMLSVWLEDKKSDRLEELLPGVPLSVSTENGRYVLHTVKEDAGKKEKEVEKEKTILIAPNPVQDNILRIRDNSGDIKRIMVIDLMGRVAGDFNDIRPMGGQVELELNLLPGIYQAVIFTGMKVIREKFVISAE